MSLPRFPDGVTADWLTGLLRGAGYLSETASVASLSREQVGDGTGMMSELSRLRLSYAGDTDLPNSFVIKYPSQNDTNREVAMSYKLYEREVRYFSELDAITAAYSPKSYVTQLEGDNFLILMEDMEDYRVGDQAAGADLRDTERAVDELAKLHGSFWGKTNDLDWVPGIAASYHADNMATLVGVGWPNMCDIFADYLDPQIAAIGERFSARIRELQADMYAEPVTLLHGDFRMENIFFGDEPEQRPIAIFDWQGPIIGRGMVDVALFLAHSARIEVRRDHQQDLLGRYVEGLKRAGVLDYEEADAWRDYERAMLYNWVYTGVVSGTLDVHNEKAFAWMSQMVERHSKATLELDVLRLL